MRKYPRKYLSMLVFILRKDRKIASRDICERRVKVTLVISCTIGVLCATVTRLRKFICVRRETEREEDETLLAFSVEVEIGG